CARDTAAAEGAAAERIRAESTDGAGLLAVHAPAGDLRDRDHYSAPPSPGARPDDAWPAGLAAPADRLALARHPHLGRPGQRARPYPVEAPRVRSARAYGVL